ncbi:MAG TPA: hypothetical protein VGO80_21670 [Solirubrobacteraceae bacterium]|jgi:hypothetical protein|nr:hypothetical protein [Solirubrobacteraceae bacterium]
MTLPIRRTAAGPLCVALLAAVAIAASPGAPQAAGSKALNGTFRLKAGSHSGGKPRGTYFRMILARGQGYLKNPDSRSRDKTYTLGRPGRDLGLVTGRYQSHPSPAFASNGSARANRIIKPESFTSINFSVATPRKDPQSKKYVAAPSARVSGRRLTVSLPGYTAEWNKQYFNQGAPKPNGSGRAATGTFNAKTKHFVLTWTSKISGGPFNGFSGYWHLEGTFSPG